MASGRRRKEQLRSRKQASVRGRGQPPTPITNPSVSATQYAETFGPIGCFVTAIGLLSIAWGGVSGGPSGLRVAVVVFGWIVFLLGCGLTVLAVAHNRGLLLLVAIVLGLAVVVVGLGASISLFSKPAKLAFTITTVPPPIKRVAKLFQVPDGSVALGGISYHFGTVGVATCTPSSVDPDRSGAYRCKVGLTGSNGLVPEDPCFKPPQGNGIQTRAVRFACFTQPWEHRYIAGHLFRDAVPILTAHVVGAYSRSDADFHRPWAVVLGDKIQCAVPVFWRVPHPDGARLLCIRGNKVVGWIIGNINPQAWTANYVRYGHASQGSSVVEVVRAWK